MHASRHRLAAGLLAVTLLGAALAIGAGGVAGAAARRTYVVRDGDTLSEIAARYGVTTGQLVAANAIDEPNRIHTGQRLVVPSIATSSPSTGPSRLHVVRSGESFWSIAHENGITVRSLAAANGRSTSSVLHTGDRLVVPAGAADTSGVPARLVRSGRISLRPTFVRWASRNGISPSLLQAVCYLESGWQSDVVSHTGALGVCQLMPASVDFAQQLIGVHLDPRDPEDNIRMGARTLRWLLVQTNGNTRRALAAYYQGLGSLRRSGAYPETVRYVDGVQALVRRF